MNLGFSYKITKNNQVFVYRNSKKITILRGSNAIEFIEEEQSLDDNELQQILARLTGNYKRGNEKLASNHIRNKKY